MNSKDRSAIFELLKALIILIVIGITLGALYVSPWQTHTKLIVFGFIFILSLIANEISRVGNINFKSLDALTLIFMQLNLMGKKDGVKRDQAQIEIDKVEEAVQSNINIEKKLLGDFELLYIGIVIVIVLGSAYLTYYIIS